MLYAGCEGGGGGAGGDYVAGTDYICSRRLTRHFFVGETFFVGTSILCRHLIPDEATYFLPFG